MAPTKRAAIPIDAYFEDGAECVPALAKAPKIVPFEACEKLVGDTLYFSDRSMLSLFRFTPVVVSVCVCVCTLTCVFFSTISYIF
jgi:hypothetical protein